MNSLPCKIEKILAIGKINQMIYSIEVYCGEKPREA